MPDVSSRHRLTLEEIEAQRSKRINNLPVLRHQRAIVVAQEAAAMVKGGPLTTEETHMVEAAVQRALDIIEADTHRVTLCDEEDYVVETDTSAAVDCPKHGPIVKSLFSFGGFRTGGKLAVVFGPIFPGRS